jgi:hypothetical protein
MNHTKEPWEVIAVDDMYEIHSKTAGQEVVWSIDSIANAQRIVACVNACEGITTEALEKGFVECAVRELADGAVQFYFDGVKMFEEDV